VALVAPHYFVGSFDDDAGYIVTGRALLAGDGFGTHLANTATVAGSYPPGYSALLTPLLWLWPHTFVPLRLLSTVCYVAIFPLTWMYLGRRRVGEGVRVATLALLALGPPLATYGAMVMAEAPFIVLFLCLLLWVDRWERQGRVWTWTGLAVVLAAAGLIWLKEAAIGVAAGLVLWLLLRRSRAALWRAGLVAGGVVALLLPVALARISEGIPLAGSRYSQELGGYYHGGLVDRVLHVAPHALWQLLSTALPATLVPYLSPLPFHGHASDLWKLLSWHVSILAVVGAVVWARRHRDAATVIVPVYLAETLLWPYINERRVILVLPVLAAWYVLGAQAVARAVWTWWMSRPNRAAAVTGRWRGPQIAAVGAVALVVAGPLALQLPRDYLLNVGQDTSHFAGSRYVSILNHLGSPGDVVETSYLSSTALFAGHHTAGLAFTNTLSSCDPGDLEAGLALDNAGYLLLGEFNKPGVLDSPCLSTAAGSSSWAVQLLHTDRDNASVFELIGPGTAHPDLRDLTSRATLSESVTANGATTLEWDWSDLAPVTQVSAGEAATTGSTTAVVLQLRGSNGTWRTVAASQSPVGDGRDAAPYLLANLPADSQATAMRLVITGEGVPVATDVHALGPDSPPPPESPAVRSGPEAP
jgi:hypothetical protein